MSSTEIITKTTQHKPYKIEELCPKCGHKATVKSSWIANDTKYIMYDCLCIVAKLIPKGTPFGDIISNSHLLHVATCLHKFDESSIDPAWPKNKCIKCGEFKPYDFQIEGMKAIETGLATQKGFGNFDDMGLGKTVQGLGYIKYHLESCPFLWIGKAGIKFQYYKEFIRWLGPDYIAQVIETGRDGLLPGLKAYIAGYDILRRFRIELFKEIGIKTVIIDECQHIKNPDSSRTKAIRDIIREIPNVILLSGTPWKNRGSELFVALNMIDPTRFSSLEGFKNRWVAYNQTLDGKIKEGGIRNIPQFKEYCQGMFIRREQSEVMPEIPPITRNAFQCQLDDDSQKSYDNALNDFVKNYAQHLIDGTEDSFKAKGQINEDLMRMRHIIALSKVPSTLELAEEFVENTDRKLAIFVHHIDVGKLIHNQLQMKKLGIPIFELTGSMDSMDRNTIQDKFNATDKCILIASTLASGEGLNLQTCSDFIMHERQWNPANEEQAERRFKRIGQLANKITGTYVLALETAVEKIFYDLVEQKRKQFHDVMNKGDQGVVWNESEMMKDVAAALFKEFNSKRINKVN